MKLKKENNMKIIGITACPTGIAHTYMAQENLELECKKRGYDYKFETQGGMGVENKLKASDIEDADVVILAVSVTIEGEERFKGKPLLKVPVNRAVRDVVSLVDEALALIKEG